MTKRHSMGLLSSAACAALVALTLTGTSPTLAAAPATSFDELKQAVEALSPGDHTVELAADFAAVTGTTARSITVPANVNLTLAGAGTGADVGFAAGATGRHLEIKGSSGKLTLEKLHFTGPNDPTSDPSGAGRASGGGVAVSGFAEVDVADAEFSGIDGSSGLVVNDATTVAVDRTSFIGNRASSSAAIMVPSSATATIRDSLVENNHGTWPGYAGGAIRLTGKTDLTIERTVFRKNLSVTRGGAIAFHQMDGKLTVRDSVFEGNSVPLAPSNSSLNDGGAIAVTERPVEGDQSGVTTIDGSTFIGNVAADEGGAILAHSGPGSQVNITASTFYGNVAQGLQARFDDMSGGGAIESFGTPLTLTANTFVNNIAERGTLLLGATQRGGAVSMYGDSSHLPRQELIATHNLFVGNQVLDSKGAVPASNKYRQVWSASGVDVPAGTPRNPEDPGSRRFDDELQKPTRSDELEPVPEPDDRGAQPEPSEAEHAAAEAEFDAATVPFAQDVLDANIGIDNGEVDVFADGLTPLAVFGSPGPAISKMADDQALPTIDLTWDVYGANDSPILAGNPNVASSLVAPGTFIPLPNDGGALTGIAHTLTVPAPGTLVHDQRGPGFGVNPTTAGSLQQGNVRFDPNGGSWTPTPQATPLTQQRIVQPDSEGVTRVWRIGAYYLQGQAPALTSQLVPLEEAPTPPTGKVFAGWNTAADGSGTTYSDALFAIPAGNLALYAQWEADTPPLVTGTVTVNYVDADGAPLRAAETLTGEVGADYTTVQRSFDGYTFQRVEGVANGKFEATPKTVTYHYAKVSVPPKPPVDPPGNGHTIPETGWNPGGTILLLGAAAAAIAGGLLALARRRQA